MTTISSAGTMTGAGGGILDKERTIAAAGFNRWLVPPAALCIHLCIGMAYGFSVFWLPLSRAIGLTAPKACPDISLFRRTVHHHVRLEGREPGLDVHPVLRRARSRRGRVGRLARAGRTAQGRLRRRAVLVRRSLARRHRHLHASALADVARFRRDRRHWPWPRLHLAGVDLGEVVPGSPRHGDRHGHHGLRRWRDDRRAARRPPDELLQDSDVRGRLGNLRHHGRDLLRVHDDRRVPLSPAAGRLASRRLDPAERNQDHDLAASGASRRRAQDAAVLAGLVGADA